MTEETLFEQARQLVGNERVAFLDRECPDPLLRARVEALLAADAASYSPLDGPVDGTRSFGDPEATGSFRPASSPEEAEGAIIAGRYKLRQQIGEGGMGTVWMADQTEPVKRKVAVKLIKAGMDSKLVLTRFEAERQALALMDHPNIAKVLDGGIHSGRPFFVMELIKGTPITEYCDATRLTPAKRLDLFIQACQAIQHAHQKGIIHRDIKPSNVLVAMYDDKPVVKVIDFGVAKATGGALTEHTLDTGFGGIVGTPSYMSPEQATFNNLDIDTRSDVYALGVLLYELLTGTPPFSKPELEKKGLLEILRIVREEEPPRPSTKLSTSEALPSLSVNRGTEPTLLTKLLRTELDWVVMKALEKDRTRRYETATAFAADVQRYLSGETVQAVPPSRGYRLQKAYRKNRTAVWVTSGFLGIVTLAGLIAGYLAIKATRAESLATDNADAYFSALVDLDNSYQKVELTALSQRIDADLATLQSYPRPHVGLLKLARTLRSIPKANAHRHYILYDGTQIALNTSPEYLNGQQRLREFLTVAILAGGQEFAPLLPPIKHEGHKITELEISKNGQFLVTLGADRTARLWDVQSSQQLAVLRFANEAVVKCGFSPDGTVAFTDDDNYTVRLWDVPSGQFRARTELVAGRLPKANENYREVTIGNGRLLTLTNGAVELWDTTSGKRIARLDHPQINADKFQLLGARWVSAIEGSSVVLYSSESGRMLKRLPNPAGLTATELLCSPDESQVVTKFSNLSFQNWRTSDWHADPAVRVGRWAALRVLNDGTVLLWDWRDGMTCSVYRPGLTDDVITLQGSWDSTPSLGNMSLLHDGRIVDTSTRRLIRPASGVEPHSLLSRFAPDGRFAMSVGVDALTGKAVPVSRYWQPQVAISEDRYWWAPLATGYIPRFGQVAIGVNYQAEARIIPPLDRLDIPAEQLELWLQVALRGELGPDGEFAKWDEPTWEMKRQQLTKTPPPYSDLPFPGYLASDKLHWLRAEYQGDWLRNDFEGEVGPDFFSNLAKMLLDRAELEDMPFEMNRWKQTVAKYTPEIAPTPRVKK